MSRSVILGEAARRALTRRTVSVQRLTFATRFVLARQLLSRLPYPLGGGYGPA